MQFTVYILYSAYLNRYYVGYTSGTVESRLRKHNCGHHGFTGKKPDWVIKYTEIYATRQLAMEREKQIKKWKSRIKIETLIASH